MMAQLGMTDADTSAFHFAAVKDSPVVAVRDMAA